MARAAAVQAAGAAMIEAYVNEECQEIHQQALAQGKHDHPRFSPGYGDLPLEMQKDVMTALDCGRTVGITLTDSLLMTPSKSVTAIIGMKERKPE
jgi:cobalamin-dependent methionine synthase I